MDFTLRNDALEHLDLPGLDRDAYKKMYKDINRCNTLLGGTRITLNAIDRLIDADKKESYTIYDMGCGDGDMLRQIGKHLSQKAMSHRLVGVDLEDTILDIATEASSETENIHFIKQDILSLGPDIDCDIIVCSLTMHHFTNQAIENFLDKFVEIAKVGIIINDLERNKLAYYLFKVFSLFLIESPLAKNDGLISISKGFRLSELKKFASRLKEHNHSIQWKWAFRYIWILTPKLKN